MNEPYDIAVVGAGIVGVSTALHLLAHGKKVALIDRRPPGQETSFGNAGVVGNGYVLPFGFPALSRIPGILLDRDTSARVRYADLPRTLPWIINFYFKSLPTPRRLSGEKLRPLIARAVDEHKFLMRNTDAERYLSLAKQVSLFRSANSFANSHTERQTAQEMGVPFEIFDAAAFHEIEPHLKPVFHKIIRWTGGAHLNNPGAVTTVYAERFVREGGTFIQTEIKGGSFENLLGDIQAKQIVICAGPWSAEILKTLGYHFPMMVKRGYHQHYSALNSATLSHAITDVEYGYVLSNMEQGYRITTGAEFAALDSPPTPVHLTRVLPHARELFPLGEPRDPTPWHGSRPCFADSLPVIGRAPRHPGLWLNFGHGHMGMTIGPSSGRLLAEMMSEAKPFCDPAPYRAERFSC